MIIDKSSAHLAEIGLEELKLVIRDVNERHGWREMDVSDPLGFPTHIALLHSEASEALEAYREHGFTDMTGDNGYLPGTLPKPEGVGSEMADVLIRLIDMCDKYDIDLAREVLRKIEFNDTRSYKHGNKKV